MSVRRSMAALSLLALGAACGAEGTASDPSRGAATGGPASQGARSGPLPTAPSTSDEPAGEQANYVERAVLEGTGGSVEDVYIAGTFEGCTQVLVGTGERSPFRVFALSDPARLVVDIAD